jgi:HD-GYP domain-containing protein (c-di-GMP phosphodiesterase class II)
MAREAKMIRHHHERWDGKGYPDGLKGEEIPIGSAIIGVVDAFDTITSDRPYRRGRPKEDAMEELLRCSGAQFNPLVVGAFFMYASRDDNQLASLPTESSEKSKGAVAPAATVVAGKVDRKRA